MSGIWVPVIGTICTAIVLAVYFFYRSRAKSDIQKTIRMSLDKGNELTPELLEKLSISTSPKVADLRKGVVLVALGVAFILAGYISHGFEEATAIGMFPMMLGFGFLAVWKINKYE